MGADGLPGRVVRGDDLSDMSLKKKQRLLSWLRDQAKREFGIRPPGAGKEWWVVPMPSTAGTGWVALGVGRSPARGGDNWRVLAFTRKFGPAGVVDLAAKVGLATYKQTAPLDSTGLPMGKTWLDAVLALEPPTEFYPGEALDRLWIILGRTNAYGFQQ